jgi:hypothetical protein
MSSGASKRKLKPLVGNQTVATRLRDLRAVQPARSHPGPSGLCQLRESPHEYRESGGQISLTVELQTEALPRHDQGPGPESRWKTRELPHCVLPSPQCSR